MIDWIDFFLIFLSNQLPLIHDIIFLLILNKYTSFYNRVEQVVPIIW